MIRRILNLKSISRITVTVLTGVFVSGSAFAQEGLDDIEGLFNKDEQQTPDVKIRSDEPAPPPLANGAKASDIKGVSDLGKLSEFSDIAVIQKRYLPKTGRFEAFIAPTIVLNDAFFINYGLNARIGYSFQERFSVEVLGFLLGTAKRAVTTGLEDRGVTTTSLVTPKSYLGVDFKWTPVYGKMAVADGRIVPFDLYLAAGVGATGTLQGTQEPTLHLGTGQIFARSKGTAYRWDFSWNGFTAQPTTTTSRSFYNTLFISVGMSFLFPEATYR
jgi:outer membrane beta-barrel protein